MTKLEGENFHIDGSPAESELTGVVSGETAGKDWTEAQDEYTKKQRAESEDAFMKELEVLGKKYTPLDEDIAWIFEKNASDERSPRARAKAVIDGLLELSKRLQREGSIEADSRRNRISVIVNRLRRLL